MTSPQGPRYFFRVPAFLHGDPTAVQNALIEIREAHGGDLTTEDVIEAARDDGSALHGEFTWDIQQAAYERWTDQARELIRSLRVIETDANGVEFEHAAYLNVRVAEPGEPARRVYRDFNQVIQDEDALTSAVRYLQAHLDAVQRSIDEVHRALRGAGNERLETIAALEEVVTTARQLVASL